MVHRQPSMTVMGPWRYLVVVVGSGRLGLGLTGSEARRLRLRDSETQRLRLRLRNQSLSHRPCIRASAITASSQRCIQNHNAPSTSTQPMHHAAVPRRAPGTERPSWHWHRFSLDSRACSHYQMTCGVPPESPRRRHLTGHAPCLVRAYVPGDPFAPVPVLVPVVVGSESLSPLHNACFHLRVWETLTLWLRARLGTARKRRRGDS